LFNLSKISNRLKINEGYKNIVYKDQLGSLTIGYGHLVKRSDGFLFKKKYPKGFLINIFNNDLKRAITDFKRHYSTRKLPNNVQEVLIEMVFQLGIKHVLDFKKFNLYLKKKLYYLAAFEMMNSRWYQQTPKRVNKLIIILLEYNAEK